MNTSNDKDNTPEYKFSDFEHNITELWIYLKKNSDLESILLLSLLVLRIGRMQNDSRYIDIALIWMESCVKEKFSKNSSNEERKTQYCSFCGKMEPEVKLFAGAEAFICCSCIELMHGIMHRS